MLPSLLTALALFVSHGFWPVLIVYALQGATYAPYMPVTEAILVNGVRRWGYDYGRMRMWGSLAFILSTLVGGYLIGLWGGKVVLPAMVFGFILSSVGCFMGLRTTGGTQGVGVSTTRAVVVASVGILSSNFFLSQLLLVLFPVV